MSYQVWYRLLRKVVHQQFTVMLSCLCIRLSAVKEINSLALGRPGCHFKTAIFNLISLIGILTLSNDNALRWMPWDLTDDKSTLVQVMDWCHQATSHYLSQCWPSSMSPYGVTRPQWVKLGHTEFILRKHVIYICIFSHFSTLRCPPCTTRSSAAIVLII